jgi:hypothetical protein
MEEATGRWFHDLYSSQHMIQIEHVAHMREMRNTFKILVDKPEGKRSVRRPRLRLEGNIEKILNRT